MIQGVFVGNEEEHGQGLEKGKKYFLFPNGESHYYVSKFPNPNAHRGCFQAILFRPVKEEEWPIEPPKREIKLEFGKIYQAKLIWRNKTYESPLGEIYYIEPSKGCNYIYKDKELKKFIGGFPLHWFEDFKELQQEEIHIEETVQEEEKPLEVMALEYTVCEQLSLF